MNERVRHLTEEAAKLTPEEQAELIDALLALNHEPTPEWEKAWSEEAERRWQGYQRGEMKSYTWDEVKTRIWK